MKYRIVASLLVIAAMVISIVLFGTEDGPQMQSNIQPAQQNDSGAASSLRIP